MDTDDDLSRHAAGLRRTARALLGPGVDADDVVQETWARALVVGGPPTGRPSLAWLRGIARNIARGRRRSGLREGDARAARAAGLEEFGEDAAQSAVAAETAVRVARAVRALPDPYREVVVQRYWLGRGAAAIAEELGVPRKTVSNRLHRALAQLRRELDDEGGGRGRHALALLGAPSFRELLLPSTLMKISTVHVVASVALLGAFAVWFGLDAGERVPIERASVQPGAVAAPSSGVAAPAADAPLGDLATVTVERERRESVAELSGESDDGADAAEVPAVPPTLVRMRVVDGETGLDVSDLEVRGTSAERYLAREVSSPFELHLTPGEWTLAFHRPDYETHTLEPVRVVQGDPLDLPTVELERGWGEISGAVDVPASMAADGPWRVELFGDGRGQCIGGCEMPGPPPDGEDPPEERCTACGHAEESSVLSVVAGAPFAFDRLAAGAYVVTVSDVKGRLRFQERVDLLTGERRRLDLRLDFVDVEFLVIGPDGEPFDGEWVEDDRNFTGPLEFYFRSKGVACASARTSAKSSFGLVVNAEGEVEFHVDEDRTYLRDPRVIQREELLETSMREHLASQTLGIELAMSPEILERLRATMEQRESRPPPPPTPDDEPRLDDHAAVFVPRAPSPELRTEPLDARRVGRGRYRVEGVPIRADGAFVSAGPFFVTLDIDFARAPGTPIEIRFGSRCTAPSDAFVGRKTCFGCHDSSGIAQMRW